MNFNRAMKDYMTELGAPDSVSPENIKAMLDDVIIKSAKKKKDDEIPEINASIFLKAIKHEKLTGNEFLEIIGNSRISKSVYEQIEKNPQLTFNQLVELFESTDLENGDYMKLLAAAQKRSKTKAEALRKISEAELASAISRNEQKKKEEEQKALKPEEKAMLFDKSLEDMARSFSNEEPRTKKVQQPVGEINFSLDDEPIKPKTTEENSLGKVDFSLNTGMISVKELNLELEESEQRPAPVQNESHEDNDEDDDYARDETYDDSAVQEDNPYNKKFIIYAAFAAVFLIAVSFGLRYLLTGSFALTEDSSNIVEDELTQEEIYDVLAALKHEYVLPTDELTTYYTEATDSENADALLKSYSDNSYIYYCRNNKLYVVSGIKGQMTLTSEITRSDATMLGFAYVNGVIAVVYEKENKDVKYQYQKQNGDEITDVNGTYDEKLVIVEVYNGSFTDPTATFSQSGSFRALLGTGTSIYAVTDMTVSEKADKVIPQTYMPYFYANDETEPRMITAQNIYFPDSAEYSNYTVIGGLDLSMPNPNMSMIASLGGKSTVLNSFTNSLYLAQNSDGKSEIVKCYLNKKGTASVTAHSEIAGNITSPSLMNETGGIMRVISVVDSNGTRSGSVYLFSISLDSNAVVNNIAAGQTINGVAFDKKTAYIVTDGTDASLFAVDTSAETPVLMPEISQTLYSEPLAKWDTDMYVSFVPSADEQGNRTGYTLTVYNTKKSMETLYSTKFVPISNMVDYSKYLSSPADDDASKILISTSNNLIIVPVKYYNGVAEVEQFEAYSYSAVDGLTAVNRITAFDLYSDYQSIHLCSGYLYAIFGDKIISASKAMEVISELVID